MARKEIVKRVTATLIFHEYSLISSKRLLIDAYPSSNDCAIANLTIPIRHQR